MAYGPLPDRLPELLLEIRRGRVPAWARALLIAMLQKAHATRARRAEAAIKATKAIRERTEADRAAIRATVGRLLQERPGLTVHDLPPIVQRRIAAERADDIPVRVPGIKLIRGEVEKFGRTITGASCLPRYSATHATT